MKKYLIAVAVVLTLLGIAGLVAIAVERGQFIEVQKALHAEEIADLTAENDRLNSEIASWKKVDEEWRVSAAPAFARMKNGGLFGETPEGLADALNPCIGPHGEVLAMCLLLNIERGDRLPIRIVHERPLKLN